jgi:hypothetical protein
MLYMFYAYLIIIALSFLAGLSVYFQKGSPAYLRLFPVFLIVTLFFNAYGLYLSLHGYHNVGIFNAYNLISTSFFLYVLRSNIVNHRIRKIVIWTLILFVSFAIWNAIFWQKMENFNNVTFALGSLFIVAFSFAYFIETFQKRYAVNLLHEPSFWICSGLIFFNTCALPYFGLIHMIDNLPQLMLARITIAELILNMLLYSTFAIAFLCRLQIRKYT